MNATATRPNRREEREREIAEKKPNSYFTEVTPEMAEEWLKSSNIRKIRSAKVEQFRRDMLAKKWRPTGQAIHFNQRGKLIDGFHRLTACVLAGVNFPALIAENMPDESLGAIDRGSPRSLADHLRWKGETDVQVLAAVIRLSWMWDHGYLESYEWAFMTPTLEEVMAWFEENRSVREGVAIANKLRKPPLYMLPSVSGAFYWRAHPRFPEELDAFLHQLAEGQGLEIGNPVLAYRRLLANQRAEPGARDQRRSLAELLKTFGHWKEGRSTKTIIWKAGVEKFPQLDAQEEE